MFPFSWHFLLSLALLVYLLYCSIICKIGCSYFSSDTESVWVLLTESVDKVKKEWKSKYSKFLENSKERRCELSTENGVPLDHRGRPSILLDRLTVGWTKKDVGVLWDRATDMRGEVVPVIGVSGSGKTRFLYELLAEKWGFFGQLQPEEMVGQKISPVSLNTG